MSSTYWTFRAELVDRPGGLAAASGAIADLGANILDVDVHLLDHDRVADDLVVELPHWAEPGAVEHALRTAGADAITGRRLDHHDLVDGQVRTLDVAAMYARSDRTLDDLASALAQLLGSDDHWISEPGAPLTAPVVAEARDTGGPAVGTEPRIHLGGRRGTPRADVLAVPTPHGNVVVLARRHPCFSTTEVARAGALAQLAASLTERRPEPNPRPLG